jgi:hypothetical protein
MGKIHLCHTTIKYSILICLIWSFQLLNILIPLIQSFSQLNIKFESGQSDDSDYWISWSTYSNHSDPLNLMIPTIKYVILICLIWWFRLLNIQFCLIQWFWLLNILIHLIQWFWLLNIQFQSAQSDDSNDSDYWISQSIYSNHSHY